MIFIIGVISLIGTFAIDTTITEGNSSKADYLFNIVLGDRTNRDILIPSYDSKIVDIKISNPNEFNMSYLLYLEGVNSNISIINISDTDTNGVLNSKNTNLVKVFIQNNSSTDTTVSIKDIVGFEKEVLELPSNSTEITKDVYYKAIVKSNNNTYGKVKPNIKLSTKNGTVKYTLVPNTGYQYKSNTCNGTVSNNILTISNITSNVNCEVVFEPKNITVSLDLAGGNFAVTYTQPQEYTYKATYTGDYKLETWGAQGGQYSTTQIGYGSYSTGVVSLKKGDILYLNVGGQGVSSNAESTFTTGGYNGGGNANYSAGTGGGATHIATKTGLLSSLSSSLSSILIVSGGGGGTGVFNANEIGGSGGGIQGNTGGHNSSSFQGGGGGGTQTSGGTLGSGSVVGTVGQFGLGGQGGYEASFEHGAGGGGGGLYGGAGGSARNGGGGGGSSYIGNSLLTNKYMYCYNCATSDATDTKTYTTTNASATPTTDYAKSGDGAARVTLISDTNYNVTYKDKYGELPTPTREGYTFGGWYTGENGAGTKVDENTVITIANNHTLYAKWNKTVNVTFDVAGGSYNVISTFTEAKENIYTVPYTGTYKLETWGAEGGATIDGTGGGYGGYSTGTILLNSGDILYVNVGGQGSRTSSGTLENIAGGYNGGGLAIGQACCNRSFGSGGGATHIATKSGLLSSLSSNLSDILIVSGGGGGAYYGENVGTYGLRGGSGGGYIGNSGAESTETDNQWCAGLGGTQTAGGAISTNCSKSSDVAGGTITGSFGQGGGNNFATTGGGGGFYGGSRSGHIAPGGGGSGYIGNSKLSNKYMYCYYCATSDATSTKTYATTTNVSGSPVSNYVKSGNGAARIILTSINRTIQQSQKYGDMPTPTRSGYTFDGWYTGENGTGTKVTSDTIVTNANNHTLYAHWIIKVYTITFNKNGGTGGTDSTTIVHGTKKGDYPNITLPTMSGYIFNGYYDSASGGTQYYNSSGQSVRDWDKTSNTTLYAQWKQNARVPSFTYTGSYQVVDDNDNVISSPSTYIGNWKIRFLTSGTLTFSNSTGLDSGIDIFVVGGGGTGARGGEYIMQSRGGGGGGGGAAITVIKFPAATGNSYSIVIGGNQSNSSFGLSGTAYFTALAGGTPDVPSYSSSGGHVAPVGSGGAGRLSGQTSYYGASNVIVRTGGAGNGSAGNYEFNGSSGKRYGAGGSPGTGGVAQSSGGYSSTPGSGGADGGGRGGAGCSYVNQGRGYSTYGGYDGTAGTANTGSGGGGGGGYCGYNSTSTGTFGWGAAGGSGIVIIRNTR